MSTLKFHVKRTTDPNGIKWVSIECYGCGIVCHRTSESCGIAKIIKKLPERCPMCDAKLHDNRVNGQKIKLRPWEKQKTKKPKDKISPHGSEEEIWDSV